MGLIQDTIEKDKTIIKDIANSFKLNDENKDKLLSILRDFIRLYDIDLAKSVAHNIVSNGLIARLYWGIKNDKQIFSRIGHISSLWDK